MAFSRQNIGSIQHFLQTKPLIQRGTDYQRQCLSQVTFSLQLITISFWPLINGQANSAEYIQFRRVGNWDPQQTTLFGS